MIGNHPCCKFGQEYLVLVLFFSWTPVPRKQILDRSKQESLLGSQTPKLAIFSRISSHGDFELVVPNTYQPREFVGHPQPGQCCVDRRTSVNGLDRNLEDTCPKLDFIRLNIEGSAKRGWVMLILIRNSFGDEERTRTDDPKKG